jgi:hypothetical protein
VEWCSRRATNRFLTVATFATQPAIMLARGCRRSTRALHNTRRSFLHATSAAQAKIVCVLYPDPLAGYPPKYVRADVPHIKGYPDGQTTPTPSGVDFTPGELLGCVSGKLGLAKWAKDNGHELVVTSDKDGEGCALDQHLPTADYVISQPFWPACEIPHLPPPPSYRNRSGPPVILHLPPPPM